MVYAICARCHQGKVVPSYSDGHEVMMCDGCAAIDAAPAAPAPGPYNPGDLFSAPAPRRSWPTTDGDDPVDDRPAWGIREALDYEAEHAPRLPAPRLSRTVSGYRARLDLIAAGLETIAWAPAEFTVDPPNGLRPSRLSARMDLDAAGLEHLTTVATRRDLSPVARDLADIASRRCPRNHATTPIANGRDYCADCNQSYAPPASCGAGYAPTTEICQCGHRLDAHDYDGACPDYDVDEYAPTTATNLADTEAWIARNQPGAIVDALAAPRCDCLECGEPITGDVAEFEGLPYRTFCLPCVDRLGAVRAHLLARTAPRSAWSDMTGLDDAPSYSDGDLDVIAAGGYEGEYADDLDAGGDAHDATGPEPWSTCGDAHDATGPYGICGPDSQDIGPAHAAAFGRGPACNRLHGPDIDPYDFPGGVDPDYPDGVYIQEGYDAGPCASAAALADRLGTTDSLASSESRYQANLNTVWQD